MLRRVLCSNENCGQVFAHVINDRTIDILRKPQHQLIVTGKDFSLIGTCGRCSVKTSLIFEKGVMLEEGLKFKEQGTPDEPTPPVPPNPDEPVPPEPPVDPPAAKHTKIRKS